MKTHRRTLELLLVPIVLLALVILAVAMLFVQFRSFEQSYIHEARETLTQQAHFISRVLLPDLQRNNISSVAHYIDVFHGKPLRITVISPEGDVVADSDVDATTMDNHANRPEVANPDQSEICLERYSKTMQRHLLYYAVPLENGWMIRVSMPMSVLGGAMRQVRETAALAILLGAVLVAAVVLYLFLRVAPHFNRLQASAVAIARGNLDAVLDVPRNGLLKELAGALAVMTQQLKSRIHDLDRERNEFDTIFNALREPLLLLSYQGEVLSSNRAAVKLLGEAARSKTFRIEQLAAPELIDYVHYAFSEAELHSREIPYNDGGIQRSLLARAVRIERNGVLCVLLLLADLTELRRLEGFRSDFIANVSHEIKTPLTAILSTVETLTEMPLDAAGRTKCLDILARQTKRLNALVMDILSLAAIERRQSASKRDFADLDLDVIVHDATLLCQDEAERAKIQLRKAADYPNVRVRGDAQLLEQAIINLITNAIRYSGSPEIVVGLQYAYENAIITVEDYGCGIEAEHLPRLFERFYRVHKERSRERGGTGLGLAIVKHILILHRGSVNVRSIPGKGTTFTITLPCL